MSTEDQSPSVQRFREMIGRDEKMLIVFEWIRTAAKSDISVLILGPTGSGKEVVARMIHELSRRSAGELPGRQLRGAARHPVRIGNLRLRKRRVHRRARPQARRLELANEGTLFLDEIGDMSLIAQAKLLRVLEERRFERLGGNKAIYVDFRLISATNRPLDQFVRDTRLPRGPLLPRQRVRDPPAVAARAQVDIPVLAQRFLARYCAAQGMPLDSKSFSREALDPLLTITGRATSASSKARSRARRCRRRDDHPRHDIEFLHAMRPRRTAGDRLPSLADAERAHIVRVLEAVHWNKKEAARVLEISRGTLYRKIEEFSSSRKPRPAAPTRTRGEKQF